MLRAAVNRSIRHACRYRTGSTRSFQNSAVLCDAQNFAMPAMSPTMTQGGIIDWKFKEGDSFNSGDVLLEVETDKAQIDVEAPDDGILVKIYDSAGSKDIPVGRTIAVIAEPGDDINSLELPKPETGGVIETPSHAEESKPVQKTASKKPQTQNTKTSITGAQKADANQVFLPSVSGLLTSQGISREDALKNIPATGPKGRLLKGDVLVYLGRASSESLTRLDEELSKLSKMDLANIQIAKRETKETSEKPSSGTAKSQKPTVLQMKFDLSKLEEDEFGFSLQRLKRRFNRASRLALEAGELLDGPGEKQIKKPKKYDFLFESLVSRKPRNETFDINMRFPSHKVDYEEDMDIENTDKNSRKEDIYSLLTSSSGFLMSPDAPSRKSPDLVTVSVTVNESIPNAKEKAESYLYRLNFIVEEDFDDEFTPELDQMIRMNNPDIVKVATHI